MRRFSGRGEQCGPTVTPEVRAPLKRALKGDGG